MLKQDIQQDLIRRLKSLGVSHDDYTLGLEAANEIERLQYLVDAAFAQGRQKGRLENIATVRGFLAEDEQEDEA
jgi:hypothetical protein